MNALSKAYRFAQRWPVRLVFGVIVGIGIFAYLHGNAPATQTPTEAAQSQAFANAMAEGTPPPVPATTVVAPATDASLDTCVQHWTQAYDAEQQAAGNDDSVSQDQLNEWQDWCKQGKQAPTTAPAS